MKSFYKLRFIPTGKFYKPASGYSWTKNNLSPTGKTYNKKAIGFSVMEKIYVLSKDFPDRPHDGWSSTHIDKIKIIKTLPEEWEWVEFQVVEKTTIPVKNDRK
jgi:hypothetical protein